MANYVDPDQMLHSAASDLGFRASVKRTYDVYYALRLPPDVQIELQRRTADFRNFFCPSEIDTRDVQKLSKGPPTFNQLYDVCPAYLLEIRYLCWLSFKDVPLSSCVSFIDSRVKRRGTLLMAAWSLRVFVTRAELINWCFYSTATPKIFVEIIWSHYYFLIVRS